MGIVKGLAKIQSTLDGQNFGDGGGKLKWFKLEDGQSVNIRILQELGEEAKNYNADAGVGFLAIEHSNPDNYRNKALCSFDEEDGGRCLGCELNAERPKTGWTQKFRLYVNVLVDDGKNAPYVAVFSQGNGGKSATPTILEYAEDSGTITNRWFKISRKGKEMSDTSYTIIGRDPSEFDTSDLELFDLDRCIRDVPYEQQQEHYFRTFDNNNDSNKAARPAAKEDSWL